MISIDTQKEITSSVGLKTRGNNYVTSWVEFQSSEDLTRIDEITIASFLVHLMNTIRTISLNLIIDN